MSFKKSIITYDRVLNEYDKSPLVQLKITLIERKFSASQNIVETGIYQRVLAVM